MTNGLFVSLEVKNVLFALSDDLTTDLALMSQGKGDPWATIENISAQLELLALGQWGSKSL